MIYEFRCKECGLIQEYSCKVDDRPKEIDCQNCEGKAIRIFSLVANSFPQGRCKGGYDRPPIFPKEAEIDSW